LDRALGLVEHQRAARARDAGGERDRRRGAEGDRVAVLVGGRRRRDRARRAARAGEGDAVVAGVVRVGVAVRVGGGDGDGLRAAGGLRRGPRHGEAAGGGRVDGDLVAVAAGGGADAGGGGADVDRAFCLVELERAACLAGGEGERGGA